jgi:hypothetical protein
VEGREEGKRAGKKRSGEPGKLNWDIGDEGLEVGLDNRPMLRVEEVAFNQIIEVAINVSIADLTEEDCVFMPVTKQSNALRY